jgi:DNA mismatch endonuclease, patch repair protein
MRFDFPTTTASSRVMRGNVATGTRPEIVLGRALRKARYKIRSHALSLPGKPDFVLVRHRLAVFVDGNFWHGKAWARRKPTLRRNKKYWIWKIESNIRRDRRVNKVLRLGGWRVVRLWESDVMSKPAQCIDRIQKATRGQVIPRNSVTLKKYRLERVRG